MGGDLVQHVVKEGNAGIGIAATLTVDVDGHLNIGFFGGAGDGGAASGEFEISSQVVVCGLHGGYGM